MNEAPLSEEGAGCKPQSCPRDQEPYLPGVGSPRALLGVGSPLGLVPVLWPLPQTICLVPAPLTSDLTALHWNKG